jgi:hypothetical protein
MKVSFGKADIDAKMSKSELIANPMSWVPRSAGGAFFHCRGRDGANSIFRDFEYAAKFLSVDVAKPGMQDLVRLDAEGFICRAEFLLGMRFPAERSGVPRGNGF